MYYKVGICPHCQKVVCFYVERNEIYKWFSEPGAIVTDLCQSCGGNLIDQVPGEKANTPKERIAFWQSKGTWYKPWTWGTGNWIIREDKIEMDKVLTLVRSTSD